MRALPALLSLTTVSSGAAQGVFVGLGAEAYVGGGEGIEGTNCTEGSATAGLVVKVGYDFGTRLGLEATSHAHLWPGGRCVFAAGPPNGTFTIRSRANLLGEAFVAADLRLRTRIKVGTLAPFVSVGGGVALRSANDLPYGVLGLGLFLSAGPLRLGLQGELYLVRVRLDLYRVTQRDFQQLARVPLGSVQELRGAGTVGLVVEVPLRFCSWEPSDPCPN